MIEGTFTLDWLGYGKVKEQIGSLKIVNTGDHPERPIFGNYRVIFYGKKDHQTVVVKDHLRSDGFWALLERALVERKATPNIGVDYGDREEEEANGSAATGTGGRRRLVRP